MKRQTRGVKYNVHIQHLRRNILSIQRYDRRYSQTDSQYSPVDFHPTDKNFTPVSEVNPGGCFVIMIPWCKKPTNYNAHNYPATVLAKENVQIFV